MRNMYQQSDSDKEVIITSDRGFQKFSIMRKLTFKNDKLLFYSQNVLIYPTNVPCIKEPDSQRQSAGTC